MAAPAIGLKSLAVTCCPSATERLGFERTKEPSMTDVARLTAVAMSALVRARELSPTECTVAVLDRMAAWSLALNAFVDFDPEGALIQARAATDSITCRMMSLPSELAVISRKVSSSAPCSS